MEKEQDNSKAMRLISAQTMNLQQYDGKSLAADLQLHGHAASSGGRERTCCDHLRGD
jgi:hypothetical protein